MMTLLKYLAGPEVLWLLAYFISKPLKRINALHEGSYNQLLESFATWLPAVLLVLSIGLFGIPFAGKKLLLLRIILVAIIGTNFLLNNILNAHTEGGPGVGTVYIVGYGILLVAIPIAVVIKALVFK